MRKGILFLLFLLYSVQFFGKTIEIQGNDDEYYYLSDQEPLCAIDTCFFKEGFCFLSRGSATFQMRDEVFRKYKYLVVEKKGHFVHVEQILGSYFNKNEDYKVLYINFKPFKMRQKGEPNFTVKKVHFLQEKVHAIYDRARDREHLYELDSKRLPRGYYMDLFTTYYIDQILTRLGHSSQNSEDHVYEKTLQIGIELDGGVRGAYTNIDGGWRTTYYKTTIEDDFGHVLVESDSIYERDVTYFQSLNLILGTILFDSTKQDRINQSFFEYQEGLKKQIDSELTVIKGFFANDSSPESAINKVLTISTESGHGSGCIVGKNGYILTNHHVVSGDSLIFAVLNNGDSIPAKVVKSSPSKDLTLIKVDYTFIDGFSFPSVDNIPEIGLEVYVVGTPLDTDLKQSISKGYLSRLPNQSPLETYQFSASVNPGNSGGAMTNSSGELLGIVNAKLQGLGTKKIGFAIPISQFFNSFNVQLQ